MASQAGRVTDDRYLNWIKDTLALIYLKEGLEVFVDCQSARFHGQLLAALGNQSCNCSSKDLSKGKTSWKINCLTGLCQPWLDHIIYHHKNRPLPILATKNSDPKLWTTDSWEVIKLYQAKGCQGQHSAKDTDVAGILTVIGNCDQFHRFISNLNFVDDIQCIRNRAMHSSDLLVETIDLGKDIQTMLKFLRGLKSLSAAEQRPVMTAIDKIEKLHVAKLDLSLNREIELKALKAKLDDLETKIINFEGLVNRMDTVVMTRKQQQHKADIEIQILRQQQGRLDIETQTLKQQQYKGDVEVLTLKQRQDSLLNMINVIRGDLPTQQSTDLIRTSLSSLQQQCNTLEKELSNIKQTIKEHGDHITTLYQRQTDVSMELESQKGKLETLERLKNQTGSEANEMTDEVITALRASLIEHYRSNCLHVRIPVVADELAIENIFVVPEIKVLKEKDNPRGVLVNVQRAILENTSICKHIFYTEDYENKQIYIAGDAGMGKTLFCKYLVNLWCEAHTKSRSDTTVNNSYGERNPKRQKTQDKGDKQIMSSFKLLFYITLRDSAKLYNIDEMIDSQILKIKRRTRSHRASDILQTEGCLVIIDGLDEWVCPDDVNVPHYVNSGLPGRLDLNSHNVFLTTTRPWKFDVLNLTSKDVDKYVELVGFNSISAENLCLKIVKLMNQAEQCKKNENNFQAELQKKGLSRFHNIPVILTQLICLWFDKQDLGQSQVQLYCSMLEMLLKRADKNLQKCTFTPVSSCKEVLLPECFSNCPHCQTRQHLLVNLCKVAFEALFNETREHALVFESSQMKILGVDENNIDMCLKSGILSQSKVLGKWSVSEKKLSFLHKKLQEFLAALFITNCENAENVISRVKQFCTTVESMLEMSNVWIFLSGIKPNLVKRLLTDLMTDVVSKDKSLQQYRQNVFTHNALSRSIQTCIVDCVEEARSNGHLDLCLPIEDFVIDNQTISECLDNLLSFNKTVVKYLYLNPSGMPAEAVKRILYQVQDTRCLQKLYLNDIYSVITNMEYVSQTLDNNANNLKCLELHYITLTTASSYSVCRTLNHITALHLYEVTLSHEQKEQLLSYVSQAHTIRQLRLWRLNCTDHGRQCRPGINLSGHTQLNTLVLQCMYVEHLPAVTVCVNDVVLGDVTIAERQLRQVVHQLSSSPSAVTVELHYVTVTEDSENPVDLTDLKNNDKFVVTLCQHDGRDNTWRVKFHTQLKTTIESDSKTKKGTQKV